MFNESAQHEQSRYGELFFKLTMRCRFYQEKGELINWRAALESKISFSNGILEPEEQNVVRERLLDVKAAEGNLKIQKKRYIPIANLRPPPAYNRRVQELMTVFYDRLFETESYLDTVVNKKMSFLNVEKGYNEGNQDDRRELY